jgi:hypothetical protein
MIFIILGLFLFINFFIILSKVMKIVLRVIFIKLLD